MNHPERVHFLGLVAVLTAALVIVFPMLAEDMEARSRPLYRALDLVAAEDDTPVRLVASQQTDDQGQRHLTYNGKFPGPEIHVDPGATLRVQVINALQHLTVEEIESFNPPVIGPNDTQEVKDFLSKVSDITNLHTHGFHVSPAGRSDNVLLKINRLRQNLFTYELPSDHAPGTHWYHAHLHGSTALQVQGGMAGALIVDAPPGQSLNPPGYSVLERVLVLQFGDGGGLPPAPETAALTSGGASLAPLPDTGKKLLEADTQESLRDLVNRLDDEDLEELIDTLRSQRLTLPPLQVNGLVNPVAVVQQDSEVQRLRIVNAGSRRVDYKSLWVEGHDMYLAAMDGVNLTSLPKNADGAYVAYNEANPLVLAPGNRADVYFLATEAGEFSLMMEGEIGLRDTLSAADALAAEKQGKIPRQKFVRQLMTFDVRGADLSAARTGTDAFSVDLAEFLKDLDANLKRLQTLEPYSTGYLRPFTDSADVRREVTFDIANPGTIDFETFLINGRSYNEDDGGQMRGLNDYLGKEPRDGGVGPQGQTPWPLRSGTEEEWTITNVSTVRHPFHIHVSPFWVVDIVEQDADGNLVNVRETNPDDPRLDRWQDVVDLPPNGGSITMRHRVSQFDGLYVIHCHILQHEDRGMMINILTVPNQEKDPQGYFERERKENDRINAEINGPVSSY